MKNPKKWTEVYPQGTKEGDEEAKFFKALARHPKYEYRSTISISNATGLEVERVEEIIDKYVNKIHPPLIYAHPSNEDFWGYWERCLHAVPKENVGISQKDKDNRINNHISTNYVSLDDFLEPKYENFDLKWFAELNNEEKLTYVRKIRILSNSQFDYIFENFYEVLLEYVKFGLKLNDYQIENISKITEVREKYIKNRIRAQVNQHKVDLSKKEYDLMNVFEKNDLESKINIDKRFDLYIIIGDLEKIKPLINEKNSSYCMFNSIYNSHLHIIKYLVDEKNENLPDYLLTHAAYKNDLKILKYMIDDKKIPIDKKILDYTISKGNLDTLKYLIEEKKINLPNDLVFSAVFWGHLDIVKYLIEKNNFKLNKDLIKHAIKHNNLNIIKYFFEKYEEPIKEDLINEVFNYCNLNTVRYLIEEKNFKFSDDTYLKVNKKDISDYLLKRLN